MQPSNLRNPLAISVLLFTASSFLSWWLTGSYFGVSLDEGIYLNGGQRIAAGERPYTDFFSYIGPVTYWIQAGLSLAFGNQLSLLRLSTAVSIGAIVSGLFYLGRAVVGQTAGILGAITWFGIWLELPNRMEVNHRWVSMGFYSLSMAALLGASAGSRSWNFVAGGLMGLAFFTTPSLAISGGLIGAYLIARDRERFKPFLTGGVAACVLIVGVLALEGVLGGFVEGIRWAFENYTEANRFPYGRFPTEVPKRYFLQIYMGAISIPISMLMGFLYFLWKRDPRLALPFVSCVGLLVGSLPKVDAYSLHFISGPFFVLIFSMTYALVPERLKALAQGLTLALVTYCLFSAWSLTDHLITFPTRAGYMMGGSSSERTMDKLDRAIPGKSTLFVYPYLTGLYTLLDAKNTTHYEYLQPGMMNAKDEEIVLVDLAKQPPQYVFGQHFPDEDVLRIWPNSDPGKHRFTRLESWFRANYEPGLLITESNIRGQVWVRKH